MNTLTNLLQLFSPNCLKSLKGDEINELLLMIGNRLTNQELVRLMAEAPVPNSAGMTETAMRNHYNSCVSRRSGSTRLKIIRFMQRWANDLATKESPVLQDVFCKRFVMRKDELGLKIVTVAKELGVTPSTVSSYATGRNVPRSKRLFALSQILTVSPDWLFGLSENPSLMKMQYAYSLPARLEELKGTMSIQEFAKKTRVRPDHLCEVLNNRRSVDASVLCKLAVQLNCSVAYLLGLERL